MNNSIIIINGSGNSGKDEVVKIMTKKLSDVCTVHNLSTVDPIRKILPFLGINEKDRKHNHKIRDFMSDLKDLWTKYFDGPFKYIVHRIKKIDKDSMNPCLIFVHSREPEEIGRFANYFGNRCTTLLIQSDKRTGRITTNHADANVDKYDYDRIIDNNGTLDDLKNSIDEYINMSLL